MVKKVTTTSPIYSLILLCFDPRGDPNWFKIKKYNYNLIMIIQSGSPEKWCHGQKIQSQLPLYPYGTKRGGSINTVLREPRMVYHFRTSFWTSFLKSWLPCLNPAAAWCGYEILCQSLKDQYTQWWPITYLVRLLLDGISSLFCLLFCHTYVSVWYSEFMSPRLSNLDDLL